MTRTWDGAIHLAERHNTAGSAFVRLQGDGDKVVGAFLATFGVERLRELHASQAAAAGDGIAAREQAAASASGADVDPFA